MPPISEFQSHPMAGSIAAMRSFITLLLLAATALAELKPDIEFAKVGDVSLTLDANVPDGPGPFPTVILVHGGGFTKGDKTSFIKPLFEPLTKAGFTCSPSITASRPRTAGPRARTMSSAPSAG